MNSRPRVLTIRYASRQSFGERQAAEERWRTALRSALGDVLIRFEESAPDEHAAAHVRLTGPWPEPPEQVRAVVARVLPGLDRVA